MIINSFLKRNNIYLRNHHKMAFGRRIVFCYKSMLQNGLISQELKKVNINENGVKMEVIDYPREFFESKNFKKVANKYFRDKKVKVDGALYQLK